MIADCSNHQILLAGGTAVVTLLIEAAIGHYALKKRAPSASLLGLFMVGAAVLLFWLQLKLKKEKP